MSAAPLPSDEDSRLQALLALDILDSRADEEFDALVKVAALVCGTPISLVSLVDADRQWFKAAVGLAGGTQTPREVAFCAHAILQPDILEISDALEDPRFAANALVAGDPRIRFYAGMPLELSDGSRVGTLCVIDRVPRTLDDTQRQVLTQLGRAAARALENRRDTRRFAQSHARLRALSDSAPLGIFATDRAGTLSYANPAAKALFGIVAADAAGINWTECLDDEGQRAVAAHWVKAAATSRPLEMELAFPHGAGLRLELRIITRSFVDAEGRVVGHIGTIENITERNRTLRALDAERERLRIATDVAELGLWHWNPATDEIIWVNDRLNAIYGAGLTEAPVNATQFVEEFLHPEDAARFARAAAVTLKTGERFHFEGRFHRRGENHWRWVELTGRSLPPANGLPVTILGTTADITERKKTEEHLRRLADDLSQADRTKNEFLATLSHELRNPLAPLRNGLEILKRADGNPENHLRALEMMDRQLRQLVHLVDDLLDIARVSSGKIELKTARVDLRDIVSSAVEASLPAIRANNQVHIVELGGEALPLDADPTRLAQVLGNLLNNAAKYTPAGGCIRVSARCDGDEVVLEVADNGIGIPQGELAAIFEMFTQVRNSIDRAQGGLGIGLALARRLVHMHHGTIVAKSDGPEQGSVFEIRLPRAPGNESIRPPEAVPGPTVAPAKWRVLVVDDNRDSAESLAMLLELGGHVTEVSHDGAAAVAAAQIFRPQVVFLDIGLPGMNGYEVARAIRSSAAARNAILIALTGWGSESDRTLARDAGFDHHLTKPVPPERLNALLAQIAQVAPPAP